MSRKSEKALKDAQAFLAANNTEGKSEDEINKMLQNFINDHDQNMEDPLTEETAKTADDFLELAEDTTSKSKAEKYIKKALELEPDNIDAISAAVDLEDEPMEYFRKLKEALERSDKIMEQQGFMGEDYIGNFWGVLETRPYMRLRMKYVDFLIDAGMYGAAAAEGEEMLRLSENDNLGVRYRLMHIYALLEQEEKALELHKKYDSNEETQMLLPLSMLYFMKMDIEKAKEYLDRLSAANKDTKKFFAAVKKDKMDQYLDEFSSYGYQPFTIQELITEMMENAYLFTAAPLYTAWAYEQTRTSKKKKEE